MLLMSKEDNVIWLSFKYFNSPLTNSSNLFNAVAFILSASVIIFFLCCFYFILTYIESIFSKEIVYLFKVNFFM
jgi:hypothetical protein